MHRCLAFMVVVSGDPNRRDKGGSKPLVQHLLRHSPRVSVASPTAILLINLPQLHTYYQRSDIIMAVVFIRKINQSIDSILQIGITR